MKNVISTVLLGGLGNQLFQISTILSYVKEKGVKYVLGIIPMNCAKYYFGNKDIGDWGGHSVEHPITDIKNIGDVFPKLNWVNNPKKYKNLLVNDLWLISVNNSGKYIPLDGNIKLPSRILGYFFSHKHWHHNREYILDMLTPNEKIVKYINDKYSKLFEIPTISLHLRLGHKEDNFYPPRDGLEYYTKGFSHIGGKNNVLIFSDNDDCEKYREVFSEKSPDNNFTIINENVYISVIMMSMCSNHILDNSTLSFWGAYLDKKQPKCKTLIPSVFYNTHPREMIPDEYNWEIL